MLCRHGSFLSLVALLLHFPFTVHSTFYPTFYSPDDFIVTDMMPEERFSFEGRSINIIFECYSALHNFSFPQDKICVNNEKGSNLISYTSSFETSYNLYENGTYLYNFFGPKIVVGDTGWYNFSCGKERDSFYLYVLPETNRFVEQARSCILDTDYGRNIVIPCRPTAPGVDVKIVGFVEGENAKLNFNATFDPKYGFTLRNYIPSRMPVTFICSIAPDQRVSYILNIQSKPKMNRFPSHLYYFRNQVAMLRCDVDAFPRPNITWSYRKVTGNSSLECLTNSKEHETFAHLESTVWATFKTSGDLTCSACNSIGCAHATAHVTVSDEVGDFGIILTMDRVVEGDEWKLICAASIRNHSDSFSWRNERGPILPSERISIDRQKTQFMHRSILKIRSVNIEDSQEYICTAYKLRCNCTQSARHRLEVIAARAPIITDTNMKKGEITIDINLSERERVNFYCLADGMPKPNISWFKDDAELVISNGKHKLSNDSQMLELKYPLLKIDSGEYKCRAENRIGREELSQRVTIKGFPMVKPLHLGLIILFVVLAVILLILVIYVAIKIRQQRLKKRKLRKPGPWPIENRYDGLDRWEFPIKKLKLGKSLGRGAFGVVFKAEAEGICKDEAVTIVAVKSVASGLDMYTSALKRELEIMAHLGKHLNVVNLLGACTKNISKHELLVIVEFCRFGNLREYLLNSRNRFINQIDPAKGKLNICMGHDQLTRSIKRKLESDSTQSHSSATDSEGVSMLPGDQDSTQPGWFRYRGDYKDFALKPLCTQDLLYWVHQVACGMKYLSAKKVLHGDLAARNILLADDNVVKICDFGLAKDMYNEEIYKKTSNCQLPTKWLAIETLRDQIFSTQSDVWSFGIVLWEFFTLAETPYPGMQADLLYPKLVEGYRMEQPEYATREMYDIMCRCWNADPCRRPSFTELVESTRNFLDDEVRDHYNKLNDAIETTPMLNKEDGELYLKPINVELPNNRVGQPDRGCANRNSCYELEPIDLK